MAKIDVTQIEGDEGMTPEGKNKALEEFDTPDLDPALYVSKKQFDKVASELAEKKRELKEKKGVEGEAAAKEQELETMKGELDALRRESNISKNKAKLVAMGYEEALADETAEAMVDGDTEKVFANQKKHLSSVEKRVRAEILKSTPKPTPDGETNTMTLDKLRGMSATERLKYSQEHPDEYRQLYTGGN
jgi:hypothetical protein